MQLFQKLSGEMEEKEKEKKVGTRIRLGLKPNRRINKIGLVSPIQKISQEEQVWM